MANETSPLLETSKVVPERKPSAVPRILFCAFIISLSIAFTWVPMIYVFRVMTCEEYYRHHVDDTPVGQDRCKVNAIESSTAASVSLLGMTTTVFGVLNLFITRWSITKFGVRAALVQQTIFPALRLIFQITAVTIGANTGMAMIQITQFFCALGGPAGYLLVTNTFASELVTPSQRTVVFGQLQGCVMFGTASGYLLGGLSGDYFGIRRPFEAAFFLMIIASIYSRLFLPYIAPEIPDDADQSRKASKMSAAGFLGPLALFLPHKIRLLDGRTQYHKGVLLLGLGVFLGVLATGYIPVLIQMYSTNAFGFGPTENGYLMCFNSLIRGLFLTFAFPKIISVGRMWYSRSKKFESFVGDIPVLPEEFDPVTGIESDLEPAAIPRPGTAPGNSEEKEEEDCSFDLYFLRWSLVIDGALTGAAAFSTQGWHIYVAAFLLPLASGSASAAKGVMMAMCPPSQRADALSAMTLVEQIATLSTMSLFGFVFTWLADIGKSSWIFLCNAGVAVFAVLLLVFARFPPAGSKRASHD